GDISTTYKKGDAPGEYPITLTAGSADNYDVQGGTATLTVSKAPLSITIDNAQRAWTGSEISVDLGLNGEGLVPGHKVSPATITISGTDDKQYPTKLDVSEITIWDGDNDVTANYKISLTQGSLQIERKMTDFKVEHYLVDENGTATPHGVPGLHAKTAGETVSALDYARVIEGYTLNSDHMDSILEGYVAPDGGLVLRLYYEINIYTVTFINWDDTLLGDSQRVPYGGSAVAPSAPTRDGYTFIGWDMAFLKITGSLVIRAQYRLISQESPDVPPVTLPVPTNPSYVPPVTPVVPDTTAGAGTTTNAGIVSSTTIAGILTPLDSGKEVEDTSKTSGTMIEDEETPEGSGDSGVNLPLIIALGAVGLIAIVSSSIIFAKRRRRA
ncbi:MAG: InlB B-repeat-containing protein, partial [Clostridiales Family XIII bacterium]|nr:InlB B-repeat-containing protein [Clostridiales Family XIII bacterium]